MVHEVGHALGLVHEQMRPDRDDHITVLWDNIHPDMLANFNKTTTSVVDDRGIQYDYTSVMQYFGTVRLTKWTNRMEEENKIKWRPPHCKMSFYSVFLYLVTHNTDNCII